MREKGTEVIEEEKNQNKGQKGYLPGTKKCPSAKRLCCLPFLLQYTQCLVDRFQPEPFDDRCGALAVFRRARSAANLIALLRCHEISESDYRKISAKIRTAESLTDLEFTSYERTYQVQAYGIIRGGADRLYGGSVRQT